MLPLLHSYLFFSDTHRLLLAIPQNSYVYIIVFTVNENCLEGRSFEEEKRLTNNNRNCVFQSSPLSRLNLTGIYEDSNNSNTIPLTSQVSNISGKLKIDSLPRGGNCEIFHATAIKRDTINKVPKLRAFQSWITETWLALLAKGDG